MILTGRMPVLRNALPAGEKVETFAVLGQYG
jgi:hypothetical protein